MRRITEFDSLRGIAAMTIVVYHLWFPACAPMATGVNLFFVISGFLITGIVLKNRGGDRFLRTFYVRRGLRIWPIYYLALAGLVAFNLASPVRSPMDGLPYYLVHLQKTPNYLMQPEPPFIPAFLHTWTLAIEEQFYLFWPALLCFIGPRRLLPLSLALIAVPVAARAAGLNQWLLVTQCDGLVMGGLLAMLLADRERHERHRRRFDAAFLGLCAAGAAFTVAGASLMARAGGAWVPIASSLKVLFTNAFYLGVVGLVVGAAGRPALAPLRNRWLCYLGQISYGLYLYHFILITTGHELIDHYGLARSWWLDALLLAASVATAALSWHFVEQPILARKGRFGYGVGSVATPQPAIAHGGQPFPIPRLARGLVPRPRPEPAAGE